MMIDFLITLAQDAALPANVASIAIAVCSAVTSALTTLAGVWAFFRGALNDCHSERKRQTARIEMMHQRLTRLSVTVAKLQRRSGGPR